MSTPDIAYPLSFGDLKVGERFYCINDETNLLYQKLAETHNESDNAYVIQTRMKCRIPDFITVYKVEEDDLK